MMMAAMMASLLERAAPAQSQNRSAGVGDDEADESWYFVSGGAVVEKVLLSEDFFKNIDI